MSGNIVDELVRHFSGDDVSHYPDVSTTTKRHRKRLTLVAFENYSRKKSFLHALDNILVVGVPC